MKHLTAIIKLRGYKVADFAKIILNQEYSTFKYQVRNGTMRYSDIVKLLKVLNIKFEDLDKLKKVKESIDKEQNITLDPEEVKTEQEFAQIYGNKIKKPHNQRLLTSIVTGEKRLSLREFNAKYHITESKKPARRAGTIL